MTEGLSQDPRPAYQEDPDREYHLVLLPLEITFKVQGNTAVVTRIAPVKQPR